MDEEQLTLAAAASFRFVPAALGLVSMTVSAAGSSSNASFHAFSSGPARLCIMSTLGSVRSSNASGSNSSLNALASSCALWYASATGIVVKVSHSQVAGRGPRAWELGLTWIGIRIGRVGPVFDAELADPRLRRRARLLPSCAALHQYQHPASSPPISIHAQI